jgi:hypothetical protein
MLKQKELLIAALLALALGVPEAEAKRLGGGRSSGASHPAATKSTAKEEKPAKKTEGPESSEPAINVRLNRGSSSGQPANNVAPAGSGTATAVVPAAAAAGAVSAVASPAADLEAQRKENQAKLARAAAEEAKRARIIKAYEEEQAERERQLAREKQERDARRARAAHESQCQFKPVMSDEDIERCRAIYKN